MRNVSKYIPLLLIVFVSLALRLYGLQWDQGFHLHPDERQLIIVADRISFFTQLNPDFFNYGSLPVYILKGVSQGIDKIVSSGTVQYASYQGMLTVGRSLSVVTDLLTLFLICKIALLLFKKREVGFFASLLYGLAFFPIQNSHFFVVDVYLTFFTTLLICLLLYYVKKPTVKKVVLISIIFAAAVSTKFSAVLFGPAIFMALVLPNLKKRNVSKIISNSIIGGVVFFIFSFTFMPYGYIEYEQFIRETSLQLKMNSDPYIFPYTLQYVGTTPYLYYLKNIFLWGLGPVISILFLLGMIFFAGPASILSINARPKALRVDGKPWIEPPTKSQIQNILLVLFYGLYFIVIGKSAVKFMRYMLPMYPLLTIIAGYGLSQIRNTESKTLKILLPSIFIIATIIWTSAFVNIYSKQHTRIAATNWILKNIPAGSKLALEHWDDHVPLFGGEQYVDIGMTLYDQPDNDEKWQKMNENLEQADYLILASNRLYIPLQNLNDCERYKSCYPITAHYYQNLFAGKKRYTKIAEFNSYPTIPFLNIEIPDDAADESFTVYDHPRVIIFKKNL